jgi:hypothetical protein
MKLDTKDWVAIHLGTRFLVIHRFNAICSYPEHAIFKVEGLVLNDLAYSNPIGSNLAAPRHKIATVEFGLSKKSPKYKQLLGISKEEL